MAETTEQSASQILPDETNGYNGTKRRPQPMMLAALAVLVVCVGFLLIRHLEYSSWHEATDDAYLTADLIQISAQVSGTIVASSVDDNQLVKAGDLLVVLDDKTYKAGVAQAKANLEAAIAEAKGAGVSIDVTSQTGSANIQQAQGAVAQAQADIAGAVADVAKQSAGIASARATASTAAAGVAKAQANAQAAIAAKARYTNAAVSARAALESAESDAAVAERDAKRFAKLRSQGAVSEQAADQRSSAAESLRALVNQRGAEVAEANQQLNVADASIAQSRAEVKAAEEQLQAALAGIHQAEADEASSEQGVNQAKARRDQAVGQLKHARTAPGQTEITRTSRAQALARVEQAQAALQAVEIQLGYTRIYAPTSGRISKNTVEIGSLVQAGTPLMAIVPTDNIWVTANFKETQVAKMDAGDAAEIEVDGLPGESFQGSIDSLAAATGSTFALLPPDNATGNFTKVVQRIPVKIVLDKSQRDFTRLRAGMSVTAVVSTRRKN